MRVYVPSTLPALHEAHGAGELGPGPVEAYAVTPGLREWYVSDASEEDEELEYAALGRAALASLRLLAADGQAPRRRVVVAAEVPDGAAVADTENAREEAVGRVRLAVAVPLAKVAAVHVDAEDAAGDVAAAAGALAAGDGSGAGADPGAQSAVEGAEEHELLWFARQEIPALIGTD